MQLSCPACCPQWVLLVSNSLNMRHALRCCRKSRRSSCISTDEFIPIHSNRVELLLSCIGNVLTFRRFRHFTGLFTFLSSSFVNCARQLLDRSRPARAPRTGTAGRTGLKLLNTLKFEISNSTISNIVVISKI